MSWYYRAPADVPAEKSRWTADAWGSHSWGSGWPANDDDGRSDAGQGGGMTPSREVPRLTKKTAAYHQKREDAKVKYEKAPNMLIVF